MIEDIIRTRTENFTSSFSEVLQIKWAPLRLVKLPHLFLHTCDSFNWYQYSKYNLIHLLFVYCLSMPFCGSDSVCLFYIDRVVGTIPETQKHLQYLVFIHSILLHKCICVPTWQTNKFYWSYLQKYGWWITENMEII